MSYLGAVVSSAAGITAQNGSDGRITSPAGTTSRSAFGPSEDTDTGISFSAANTIDLLAGAARAYLTSTALTLPGALTATTQVSSADLALTAASGGATGNATLTNNGYLRTATSKMAITHAAFDTACDTLTTCDFKMATLPARTIVNRAYFVVDLAETHITPMTVSCGDTAGGGYIDYIVASAATSQAVYGDDAAEQGASLHEGTHIHSTSATTDVYCEFVEADGSHDLGDAEAFAGWLVLETSLLP